MTNLKRKKWLIWLGLSLGTSLLCFGLQTPFSIAISPVASPQVAQVNQSPTGKTLYDAGRFAQAAEILEQTVATYQAQGNSLEQAIALSNLSLTYQQLGLWSPAETAINQSLSLLQGNNSLDSLKITAQALNIQGRLQFTQGQVETALETWRQATNYYKQIGNETGAIRSQINQAQALQSLGFYRQTLKLLTQVQQKLDAQPDSITKAVGLRSLGDIRQLMGLLDESRTALESSLAVARRLNSPTEISATLFSLGNTARGLQQNQEALSFYQQAIETSSDETTKVQIQLNQLSLLIAMGKEESVTSLASQIESQLDNLPPSRNSIYGRINLAKSLLKLSNGQSKNSLSPIANQLAKAVKQARNLSDKRAEIYALGTLGSLYEKNQQWPAAQTLTQQALALSETINAPDITYRWQWQLGRLLKHKGDQEGAIAAYESAINILRSLRSDLVAINTDVQFSFRESVEPVYRELVSLLLKDNGKQTEPKKLEKARKVIESLQLAELDNFFRSACINSSPVQIEEVDQQAAVIYPIILPDRLEVILSMPQQNLRHYSVNLNPEEVEDAAKKMRRTITNKLRRTFLSSATEIYDWLIRPLEADLAQADVQTLVFVLDGVLRNLPMSALYDGNQYLAEKYSIAVTPGLELLESKSLKRGQQLKVLTVGLSEARQGFNPLPGVEVELSEIRTQVDSEVLLNQEFTENNVQTAMDEAPFPIVHFATHGTFSSNADDTFILTWDDQINVNELNNLLQSNELSSSEPIELLVFSACETATGDSRAALGIAGVAVRAGARSTMASLWSVSDEATSELMALFYQELANPEVTKAEALRRAQMSILQNPKYRGHPYFWAPFILVGNWL